MKFTFLVVSLVSVFLFTACGHKKVRYGDSQVSSKGGLGVNVEWIKNKHDMIDMNVKFTNNSEKAVTINETAFSLTFEGRPGVYKKYGYGVTLGAKQSQEVLFHFAFSPKIASKGTATFAVNPILVSDSGTKTHNDSVSVNLAVE